MKTARRKVRAGLENEQGIYGGVSRAARGVDWGDEGEGVLGGSPAARRPVAGLVHGADGSLLGPARPLV